MRWQRLAKKSTLRTVVVVQACSAQSWLWSTPPHVFCSCRLLFWGAGVVFDIYGLLQVGYINVSSRHLRQLRHVMRPSLASLLFAKRNGIACLNHTPVCPVQTRTFASKYTHTLFLPQTDFPLHAKASERESKVRELCSDGLYRLQQQVWT